MTLSNRQMHLVGFVLCAVALLIAVFFMERYLGFAPCPLCLLDRIIVASMAVVFLLAAVHNPRQLWQRVYAGVCTVLGSLGVAVAWRHIWLQSLPAGATPDCAPELDYLLDNFPLLETLSVILNTSGECAEVVWTLGGLSIPWQTLILFVVLVLLCLRIIFRHPA